MAHPRRRRRAGLVELALAVPPRRDCIPAAAAGAGQAKKPLTSSDDACPGGVATAGLTGQRQLLPPRCPQVTWSVAAPATGSRGPGVRAGACTIAAAFLGG